MTENKQDWRIDHSAGRPILVYQNCSVIEAEQAEYVLRLIEADKQRAAGEPSDDEIEALLEQADYREHDGEYRFDGPDLMHLLRQVAMRYGITSPESTPIGFLCPVPDSAAGPVFVPSDRTARNADDLHGWRPVYTAPQASAEAVRNAALEEAAKACEAVTKGFRIPEPIPATQQAWSAIALCAKAIRALKSTSDAERSAFDKPIPDSVEHYGLIDERVGAPAAEDSAKGSRDVDECNFSDLIDAYTDAVRNGSFSERVAARAELMNSYRRQRGGDAKDAERYRWLRVQPFEVWKRIAWNTWGDDPAVATHRDADIDAAIQEFIDATDALLESRERKSWNSGYVKDMTPMERGNVAARWRKARAALVAQKADGGDASARIALKAIAEYPIPGDGSMSAANMREIARKALMAAPLPSSPPSISYRKIESGGGGTDAAVAAIRFALEADDGMAWLRCWNEGDFDACRNEWPETPEECFIGADPLHPSTRAILAAQSSDGVEDALRQRLGEALTDAMAQNVDTDTKTFCIDPFNSGNIDPLLDAILKVLTGK